MKRKIGLLAMLVLVALLLPAVVVAQAPPAMPLLFQGKVSIGEGQAPPGTIVSAEIGGVEVASNKPKGITEAGRYEIGIEQDDNLGQMVVFKVNDVVAGQHEYVNPWETPQVELDLSIESAGTYALTISSMEGGSVTSPGEGTFNYAAAQVVPLEAQADEGYRFAGWTGDVGTVAQVDEAATTITMDGPKTISATFAEAAGPGGPTGGGLSWNRNWIIAIIAVAAVVIVVLVVRRRRSYR